MKYIRLRIINDNSENSNSNNNICFLFLPFFLENACAVRSSSSGAAAVAAAAPSSRIRAALRSRAGPSASEKRVREGD